ncbi:MAG: hypothetical protein M3N13_10975, partial [Candidatus Eremiobacteraeota bacterium]|nr:hypothetical protein [Candidatus Eremiobacteraeota bacterium]
PSETLQIASLAQVVRYASTDRTGKFACRPLAPGGYIAVATVRSAAGGVGVEVASFKVASLDKLTKLDVQRFKPLQEVP